MSQQAVPTTTADAAAVALGEPRPKATALTHGQTEADLSVWSDAAGNEVGYWECTPGRFSARRDGFTEICQILSGWATLHPAGDEPVEIGPGSTLVTPSGWIGDWDVHETIRKLFVIVPDQTA